MPDWQYYLKRPPQYPIFRQVLHELLLRPLN
jgi:hypothetical protein